MSSDSDAVARARKAGTYLELASLELTDFADAFAGVAEILGGRSFHVTRILTNGEQEFFGPAETRSVLENYFGQGWHAVDTWSQGAQVATRGGKLVTDKAMIPKHIRDRDRFFQEFCRDWDLGHYAAWTFDMAGQTWGYTLIRPHGHDYTAEDIAALEALRPSANRAALLAGAFRDARIHGIAEGLERSGRPSLVLDQHGRVVFATTGARRLYDKAFCVRQGLLTGLDALTDGHLRRLRAAIRDKSISFPPAFPMSGPLLVKPVIAIPMPMRDDFFATLPGAHALLMLIDPADRMLTSGDVLSATLSLSARETNLALLLGQGMSVNEAADQLGLKLSSTRQLAKRILAKSGCSRQSELVALVQKLSLRAEKSGAGD